MPRSSLLLLAAAVFGLLAAAVATAQDDTVVIDPAIQSMTAEQLVAARRDAMKQNAATLRGAMRATGDDAIAAATVLHRNFVTLPHLFREGSIAGESEALPQIWENWDDFKGRLEGDAAHASEALAAATAGDAAAYGAALQAIRESCRGCHQMYRG